MKATPSSKDLSIVLFIKLSVIEAYLGRNFSWALKLDLAWINPVLGRTDMWFLISLHTLNVNLRAELALEIEKNNTTKY